MSGRMLDDAKFLQQARRLEAAADRAYYAMFHAAEAAIALRGVEPGKTHSGVHSQFSEHLIKTGIVAKGYAAELDRGKKVRESSTYGGATIADSETVAHMIAFAEEFLARVGTLAREKKA